MMMTSVHLGKERVVGMPDCKNCTKKCPKAELAHNAALGRMYATSELVSIIKKIDRGELVEVVRCKDCKFGVIPYGDEHDGWIECSNIHGRPLFSCDGFCSYGERR